MSCAKRLTRCIASLNILYIAPNFASLSLDFMDKGISRQSFLLSSSILGVNMLWNLYLLTRVRKTGICIWFLLTCVLFIIRLISMPYELHGTTYKAIGIAINVYIGLSLLVMIGIYKKLVTETSAPGYKKKSKNVGSGVRFTNTRYIRSTHHYDRDDRGVEDFNHPCIDLPTYDNIQSNEDNCCAENGGGGGYEDCCADSGGGGGDYDCGGGGGDNDCGGGGGDYDCGGGGGDYDCGGGGDYD